MLVHCWPTAGPISPLVWGLLRTVDSRVKVKCHEVNASILRSSDEAVNELNVCGAATLEAMRPFGSRLDPALCCVWCVDKY